MKVWLGVSLWGLLLGITAISFYLAENTWQGMLAAVFISGIGAGITIWKQPRGVVKALLFLGVLLSNVVIFQLSCKMSFRGAIAAKVVAPIIAPSVAEKMSLSQEETKKRNEEEEAKEWTVPEGYTYERREEQGVRFECLSPKEPSDRVIFQIHGGAFCMGMNDDYRNLAAKYADIAHANVISPCYTTSELAPYPAALNDCIAVYEWVLSKGYEAKNVIVVGDSAGGNLALAMTLYLKQENKELPGGLLLMSPMTDFTFSGESVYSNAETCVLGPYLGAGKFSKEEFFYTRGIQTPMDDPYLSPLFGDYRGFPKMLIQVGTREILLDDSRRVAKKAEEAGVDVTLTEYYGMWHVFEQLGEGKIPEVDAAWKEIRSFFEQTF